MGNPESKDCKNQNGLSGMYLLKAEESDDRFGKISHYKHQQTGKLYWVKETELVDEARKELQGYMNKYKEDPDYQKVFNTIFMNIYLGDRTNRCYSDQVWLLTIVLEYFEKSLLLEIKQRWNQKHRKSFPESEIWGVCEAIQDMERHYQALSKKGVHGDVRLSNIFVVDDGSIKFLDVHMVNWRVSSFMRASLYDTKLPLAPEKLAELQKDESVEEVSSENEVWSIGIVLLCLATLQEDMGFYNWKSKTVDFNKIQKALEEVSLKYSTKLSDFIASCLKKDPADRKKMSELLNDTFSSQIF